MVDIMTWSVIAKDINGRFGIAIASRFFAVGALCVHTRSAVGALCTQALMNPLYGPTGLELLAGGIAPDEVVRRLVDADKGREQRQLHVMGLDGSVAAHTGSQCVDWCGHQVFEDFSVAGNMLAGPQVLDATAQTFIATAGRPLAERLIAAMQAGEAEGGDKRGKQAAALRVHAGEVYPELDLRVDDHAEPLTELQRLYDVSLQRFQPFVSCLASKRDPVGVTDRLAIEARITAFQDARCGHDAT